MESPQPPSLLAILWLIQRRPSMHLGGEDSERGLQLDNLEVFIRGYEYAVRQHQLQDRGFALYADFGTYLEDKFGWTRCGRPIAAIRKAARSDSAAWDDFWRLLWEYIENAERKAG
jgi:hypothetical protein